MSPSLQRVLRLLQASFDLESHVLGKERVFTSKTQFMRVDGLFCVVDATGSGWV